MEGRRERECEGERKFWFKLKFKFKWVSREGREGAEGWPRRSAALQRLVEEIVNVNVNVNVKVNEVRGRR